MNKLIIILVIITMIVMCVLIYAIGGFDWLFGESAFMHTVNDILLTYKVPVK